MRGWTRYTVGLVDELARRGVEVTLFHRAREPLNSQFVDDLPCRIVGLEDRGGLYWEQVAVPQALWRGKFHLFHAPAERGIPFLAPCPTILTVHSATWSSYADLIAHTLLPGKPSDYLGYERASRWNFWSLYSQIGLTRANHILAPSNFARGEIVRLLGVPSRKVTVTPLAVHKQFRCSANPPEVRRETLERLGIRGPYLLYVGGYEPHKNVGGLLETFSLVRVHRPDLALVLVGTKFLPDEVVAHAKRLGLDRERAVVFLVDVTDDLTDLYDEAQLFVTMSWRETFCLPALEAMTRGKLVVASRWGAAPEIVGMAGRLVDPRDFQAAADAVLELLGVDRNGLAQNVRQQAERFTWAETGSRTLEVYESLLSSRRRRSRVENEL
ncbi:MAG: glycosyltransferase family 4 protein [Candidatus Binataceae bacterium]